jgi:hypothetical protein
VPLPLAAVLVSWRNLTRFSDTTPVSFQGTFPERFSPTLVGTLVGRETTSEQFLDTSSGVLTVEEKNVLDYRVDFPNGMHAEGTDTSHFTFNATPNVTVSQEVVSELRTVFAADGSTVARVRIHSLSHVTFHDANGDGMTQPGEISSSDQAYFWSDIGHYRRTGAFGRALWETPTATWTTTGSARTRWDT